MTALAELLVSSNLDASEWAYRDLACGLVDRRLVKVLADLVGHHRVRVVMIKTGHPMGPRSPAGVENSHYFYRAVDIDAVDDQLVARRPVPAPVVDVGRLLMMRRPEDRIDTVMGPAAWHQALGSGDRTGFRDDDFANRIHHDHLHLGVARPRPMAPDGP